jgi:hypothetical protein
MGHLQGEVPDDIVEKFKKVAYKKFDYKRNAIKLALNEAVNEWLDKNIVNNIAANGDRRDISNE